MAYTQEDEAKDDSDEQLPVKIPAGPVDDQVRHDERDGRHHLAGRKLERPRVVGLLAPHRAEGKRHRRVPKHGRRDDETDELRPSRERKEHDAADKEGEDDANERHAPLAEEAEWPRDVWLRPMAKVRRELVDT